MGIQRLEVCGDSNLVISQINGDFDAKDPKVVAYRKAVLKMSARFEGLEFHHVAREKQSAGGYPRPHRRKTRRGPPQHISRKAFQAIRSMGRGHR